MTDQESNISLLFKSIEAEFEAYERIDDPKRAEAKLSLLTSMIRDSKGCCYSFWPCICAEESYSKTKQSGCGQYGVHLMCLHVCFARLLVGDCFRLHGADLQAHQRVRARGQSGRPPNRRHSSC